jgi:hypothetical protein
LPERRRVQPFIRENVLHPRLRCNQIRIEERIERRPIAVCADLEVIADDGSNLLDVILIPEICAEVYPLGRCSRAK